MFHNIKKILWSPAAKLSVNTDAVKYKRTDSSLPYLIPGQLRISDVTQEMEVVLA